MGGAGSGDLTGFYVFISMFLLAIFIALVWSLIRFCIKKSNRSNIVHYPACHPLYYNPAQSSISIGGQHQGVLQHPRLQAIRPTSLPLIDITRINRNVDIGSAPSTAPASSHPDEFRPAWPLWSPSSQSSVEIYQSEPVTVARAPNSAIDRPLQVGMLLQHQNSVDISSITNSELSNSKI